MKAPGWIARLQHGLLDELTPRMAQLGFKARKRHQSYFQEMPSGKRIVHVAFVRHSTDVDATVDLAIRLEPVEQLLESVGYGRREGATVGAELGNIVDGRPWRWTIADPSDCASGAQAMTDQIREFGLGWFERYANPEDVLSLLAAHDRASRLYSPIDADRCLSVVALAKYLGPPNRAAEVAQQCRTFLEARHDPQLRVFDHHARALLAA